MCRTFFNATLFYFLLKLKQTVRLVELLGHIGVGMVIVEKLDGMKATAIDIEMDVAKVEVWRACLPDARRQHRLPRKLLRHQPPASDRSPCRAAPATGWYHLCDMTESHIGKPPAFPPSWRWFALA